MARMEYSGFPHGVKLQCKRASSLDTRCDRLVKACWFAKGPRHACCSHLGAPAILRMQDARFEIQLESEFITKEIYSETNGRYWHEKCVQQGTHVQQRVRKDHLATLADVLQFQIDNGGRLPTQSRTDRKMNSLRKRYDRAKQCGKCGALERMRWQCHSKLRIQRPDL